MGTFTVGCLVKNPANRQKTVRIPRLLVDTGSEATWIPRRELEKAHIQPEKRQLFQMANGPWIHRDVGYGVLRVSDRETVDEIVFAEPGDYVLLGARSLEGLLLWVDSPNKRLIEIEGHPVAKAIAPGRVPAGKDRLPPFTGVVVQGRAGPPPRVTTTRTSSRRGSRQARPRIP